MERLMPIIATTGQALPQASPAGGEPTQSPTADGRILLRTSAQSGILICIVFRIDSIPDNYCFSCSQKNAITLVR